MTQQDEFDAALSQAISVLEANPQRRTDLAETCVSRGELRPYPVMYLGRGPDTDAGETLKPSAVPPPRNAKERLMDKLKGIGGPLAMLNPIAARINLGRGPGSLPASFGIHLDPTLAYTPTGWRNLDEVLAEGMPDPDHSGVIPEMREDIDAIEKLTPAWFGIGLPDMQGPFNIAHMILGDDAFTAPLFEPEKFSRLMGLIVDFSIALHQRLVRWIEPGRLTKFTAGRCRIAECSVNMISKEMYVEHVLPHDLKLAEYYGELAIHPCSGPHVFEATMEHLPNVKYHEAGFIEKAFKGSISVDAALKAIGDRSMILSIGEELPTDFDEARRVVCNHMLLAKTHPRLLFGFTGMQWRKADEERICVLHRELDEFWQAKVFNG